MKEYAITIKNFDFVKDRKLIDLLEQINLLHREEASSEIFENLQILATACMWSEESYFIVKNAVDLLKRICMNGDGVWI